MHISPNDQRRYRQIKLDNALRILLVEDPHAARSAAALSAQVGHFCDPKDREGLAHFLEHMLFLGTEKYPKVGEFQRFIQRHGGSNNAWTGTENTTFFFDIQPPHFSKALDRFGQFFSAPLFNEDAVDKERNAVNSEYRMKIQDDVRRIYQVHKATINPGHPFSKFSVGSDETLADRDGQNVRDDLLNFYQTHYSANLMTAVLIAPEPLNELETIARKHFSAIPNHHLPPFVPDEPFVTEKELQKLIVIEPLKEIRKLTLAFSLPHHQKHYQTKPLSYIAHLLGDESEGSVMSVLKKKGLINNLAAGGGMSGSNFREFNVSLSLTEAGVHEVDEIVSTVFQMLRLIGQSGLNAWRYREKQAVQEMAYRYQEPTHPIDLASHLVLSMQHYESDDILYGDFMMTHYDEPLIKSMLECLTPDRLRLILIAQHQSYDQIAPWYDTPYKVIQLTSEQIQQWKNTPISPKLKLAIKNPFIPKQFDLYPIENHHETIPQQIVQNERLNLWFYQDRQFQVPKGIVYIAIDSPAAVASVENIVKSRICVEMLVEAINTVAYPAEIAGLGYNFYANQGGATLKLTGFNENMPQLLELILEKFTQRNYDETRFKIIKTQLLRHWKNAAQNKPIQQLHNWLTGILQPNNPPYAQMIPVLENLTPDALPEFMAEVLSEIHIDMFVYGNWQQTQAKQLAAKVRQALQFPKQTYRESTRSLMQLKNAGSLSFEHDCQHDDSAVLVYYQSPETDPKNVALFNFAHQLMSATFYHQLRTKQQLGYLVGVSHLPLNRHPGLIFYVQSPLIGPNQLLDAIDDFLNAFFMVLLELTETQWQTSKAGLLAKIREPDTNLRSRAQRFWISIGKKDVEFSQRARVAEAIESMPRADMVKFVIETLKPRTADRLIMHSCGKAHLGQEIQLDAKAIEDVEAFRQARLKSE